MNVEALGMAVEQTRVGQQMTQADLSERSGVSLTTISAIERRTRGQFQATTLRSLDAALGWAIGTSEAILHDQPMPIPRERLADGPSFRFGGRVIDRHAVTRPNGMILTIIVEDDTGTWSVTSVVDFGSERHLAEPGAAVMTTGDDIAVTIQRL